MNWQFKQEVDLRQPNGIFSYPDQLMSQGDHMAVAWNVTVYDGVKPADLTGYGITAFFNRNDGKTVPVIGTANDNVVSVILPRGAYEAVGPLIGILRANKGDQVVTLATCRWTVRRGPGDEIVDSDDVIPDLEQLLAKISEMERQINAASAAVNDANQAVDLANTAIEKANEATTISNQNAAKAQEAANKADTAVTNAEKATKVANDAATSANNAAKRVDDSIKKAEDAAKSANDAANRVDDSIENANTATTNANTAAEAANEAVKTINDKVDNAITPVIDEINFLHPLSITKFTVSPSMAEKGSTVANETFAYGVNRMNVSLSLEGESVTGQTATRTDSLTEDKTYTLSASLGDVNAKATATISFVAPVYYGVGAAYDLTNETVLALTRVLTKSRARTITVNAGAGQYILYALPAALGTPVFKVGGFEGGFTLVGTFDFTNASGHMESYNLYRSVNAGLGNTTVAIS